MVGWGGGKVVGRSGKTSNRIFRAFGVTYDFPLELAGSKKWNRSFLGNKFYPYSDS
jgi:hypothetical protein